MIINVTEINGSAIAELVSDNVELNNEQDAVEIIMNCHYQGADMLILKAEQMTKDFFDLSTRVAGDILQKFSTYRCRLAIVGDFENIASTSLKDFIYESNKRKQVNFVRTVEDAKIALASIPA